MTTSFLPVGSEVVAGVPLRQIMTALALPPLLLLLVCVACGLLAWRGSRPAGLGAAMAACAVLVLSMPAVAGMLTWSLEREVSTDIPVSGGPPPAAIIVLGAEALYGLGGATVGPMTLERLRAGAALHRRTGLPLLVTAGVLRPGEPPLAGLMAHSLAEDFGTPVQWIELLAADTRGNAALSTAMLAANGITSAYVVSHAWHLPRALAAFAKAGMHAVPAPLHRSNPPVVTASDLMPRPDQLSESWFALREWAGRLVYAIRD